MLMLIMKYGFRVFQEWDYNYPCDNDVDNDGDIIDNCITTGQSIPIPHPTKSAVLVLKL